MSIVDFIAFVAAMLFLVVSNRQKGKRKEQQDPNHESEEDIFDSHEEEAIKQIEMRQRLEQQERSHRNGRRGDRDLASADVRQSQKNMQIKRENASNVNAHKDMNKGKGNQNIAAKRESVAKKARLEEAHIQANNDKALFSAYALKDKDNTSKGVELIRKLKSQKDMVILHEIFSAPKGL